MTLQILFVFFLCGSDLESISNCCAVIHFNSQNSYFRFGAFVKVIINMFLAVFSNVMEKKTPQLVLRSHPAYRGVQRRGRRYASKLDWICDTDV